MTRHDHFNVDLPAESGLPLPADDLDRLLRRWHDVNAERARAGRDRLMAAVRVQSVAATSMNAAAGSRFDHSGAARWSTAVSRGMRSALRSQYLRAAASLALIVGIFALMMPVSHSPALADAFVAEGGRLEAFDVQGNALGPCPLKHTEVDVQIAGPFTQVKVRQQYRNPHPHKIEAVYSFPLSHRAAVNRMTMTIGDRVIEAEMKERQQARQMYEAARDAGHVAGLLEQERPNIFTQSVANIEPGAQVQIEISYIETLESKDGVYTFDFPMTVAPRYIPGSPVQTRAVIPLELEPRQGQILLQPANLALTEPGDVQHMGALTPQQLQSLLDKAHPIANPTWERLAQRERPDRSWLWYRFEAVYADGSKEPGTLHVDGTGQINGRWFWCDARALPLPGQAFAQDANEVPDASRITPMPVKPPTRAGHDISLSVSINTGGPAITQFTSDLHEVVRTNDEADLNAGRLQLSLKQQREIPNRDFVLSWRTADASIQEATFAFMPQQRVDDHGGFFTLILAPPARIANEQVLPRELIFVLDTSGSMSGLPIEKAREVMSRAIDSMRERDTFNIITFAGDTHMLWNAPRPNTAENRAEAQAFLASRSGSGGTEMMTAIHAALAPTPTAAAAQPLSLEALANLPADDRQVQVAAPMPDIHVGEAEGQYQLRVRDDLKINMHLQGDLPTVFSPQGVIVHITGRWRTINGQRVLVASSAQLPDEAPPQPMRIVMFLTDGEVGNDHAIIQAVKDNAKTTRVFSFGIGNSVNRYLLEGMARAGRGEVEFVNLQSDVDAAVQRFAQRIQSPVLSDIQIDIAGDLEISETIPPLNLVPDLFDVRPLILHGRYQPLAAGEAAGQGGADAAPAGAQAIAHATVTIRGRTATGPYERTIDLDVSPRQDHEMIAPLWARAKADRLVGTDLHALQQNAVADDVRQQVIALGERYRIMTPFTSFVAIEKARLTIAGKPVLVPVPIELPEGMEWEGVFGQAAQHPDEQPNPDWLRLQWDANGDAENLHLGLSVGSSAAVNAVTGVETEGRSTSPSAYLYSMAVVPQGMHQNDRAAGYAPQSPQWVTTILRGRHADVSGDGSMRLATSGSSAPSVMNPSLGTRYRASAPATTTTGALQYPEDWPRLGNRYTPEPVTAGVPLAAAPPPPSPPPPAPTPPSSALTVIGGSIGQTPADPLLGDIPLMLETAAVDEARRAASAVSSTLEREMRVRQVTESLGRALSLIHNNQLAEAGQVIDEVLFIDPSNVSAAILRDAINSKDHVQLLNAFARVALAISRVPIAFNNIRLEQVSFHLQQVLGIDIVVDWASLETVGITRQTPVTLTADLVSGEEALRLLVELLRSDGAPVICEVVRGRVIIATATAPRQAQVAQRLREARLRRVLDQRLQLEGSPESEQLVVVLVHKADRATIDQLRMVGLRVEDRAGNLNLVAGAIAVDKLDDLALLQHVRRIEPIRSNDVQR